MARKVAGGIPVAFLNRPALDGRAFLPAMERAPILATLAGEPSEEDAALFESLGAVVVRRSDGRLRSVGNRLYVRLDPAAVERLSGLARVLRLELAVPVFGSPPPLEVTGAQVQAPDVWGTTDANLVPLTGQGVTVCSLDSGIDPFHPSFFRADGGYFAWQDVDDSGTFTPGVDTVDLGYGPVPIGLLNAKIFNSYGNNAMLGSDDPAYALGLDWLFADDNGDGTRQFGPEFGDQVPTFGERFLVADDVNGNGFLDVNEKVVALGSSKIRAVRHNSQVYLRGESLTSTPLADSIAHGTSSSGIIVGGQRGFSVKTGMAPDADIIMAIREEAQFYEELVDFCIDKGARVVLHEYAPWTGFHLDGSSALEEFVDETSKAGIAHINPAGNLAGGDKLYKHQHPSGGTTTIDIITTKTTFHLLAFSMLWRDDRALDVTLEDVDGNTQVMPLDGNIYEFFGDSGLLVYADRFTSSRGTSKVDILVFAEDLSVPIDKGTWHVHVDDPSDGPPLEVIAYLNDDVSGWGQGIYFKDHVSLEHLIGWPGTADDGIVVAAYTGHGYNGGTPGQQAGYSGRGTRIDGTEIMSISAPDDPVAAGYATGEPAVYRIFGGTSGASPHVAGVAALMMQGDPAGDGETVRTGLREGALVDGFVGSAPNGDYGYGKLRAYNSIYGQDAPGGLPPSIDQDTVQIAPGVSHLVTPTVADPDEPAEGLIVEHDADYDGVFESVAEQGGVTVQFEQEGVYVSKLRVRDSTGRTGQTLLVVEVGEEFRVPDAALPPEEEEGCACSTRGSAPSRAAWMLLGLGLLAWRRRR